MDNEEANRKDMKKKIIGTGILLCFIMNSYAQGGDRKAYIETYRDLAVQEMDRSGIPASIKLAQGILESGAGASTLSKKANNHFGIKCGSKWTGDTYYHKDDDYDRQGNLIKSCFRKYKSVRESYIAHTDFLMRGQRYAFLFNYPKTDYKNWAKGLKKAGYATNPRYADLLINIIKDYELHKFDKMTSEILVYQPETPTPGSTQPEKITERRQTINNQAKVIVVAQGDTYAQLSEIFNIPMKRLLKYNDLTAEQPLQSGDFVYTQPKRKKYRYKKDFHIVKTDDNMYTLSQKYGIKLKHIYKRNRMQQGTEPALGERIYLRKKAKHAPNLRAIGSTPAAPVTVPKPSRPNKPPTQRPPLPDDLPASTQIHIVQSGDTLYAIAQKYSMTVNELKQLNGLTSNIISIGQELKVKR